MSKKIQKKVTLPITVIVITILTVLVGKKKNEVKTSLYKESKRKNLVKDYVLAY